jgi:hypothetical protein
VILIEIQISKRKSPQVQVGKSPQRKHPVSVDEDKHAIKEKGRGMQVKESAAGINASFLASRP